MMLQNKWKVFIIMVKETLKIVIKLSNFKKASNTCTYHTKSSS